MTAVNVFLKEACKFFNFWEPQCLFVWTTNHLLTTQVLIEKSFDDKDILVLIFVGFKTDFDAIETEPFRYIESLKNKVNICMETRVDKCGREQPPIWRNDDNGWVLYIIETNTSTSLNTVISLYIKGIQIINGKYVCWYNTIW